MKVALTGATGFVGRHVVRALVSRGNEVRCLIRSRIRAAGVLPTSERGDGPSERLEWVLGDTDKPAALDDLMSGCDAVVHCIGIRRESLPGVTYAKAHPGATRSVLAAASRSGVRRFIHLSALGTRQDAATAYHRSKYESEMLVRASDLDWTILRPSLIHGPDGEFMQMVKSFILGRSAPWCFVPYFAKAEIQLGFPPKPPMPVSADLQPVYVEDVVQAILRSLDRDEAIGEVYALGGPEVLDWPALMTCVRDAMPMTDHKKRIIPLPGKLMSLKAHAAQTLGVGDLLPFGPSEPIMAIEDSVCSNVKAQMHLGYEPQDFVETMQGYAAEI